MFFSTINPPANGQYLSDETGERRNWPIRCRDKIDLDGFARVRDQLWAEAVQLFHAEHPWHLETPELEALATAEQNKRFKIDALEPQVREYLKGKKDANITDVLLNLCGPNSLKDQQLVNRVQKIVTRIGYTDHVRTHTADGKRPRVYRKPETQD
jgi:predicted P-loop ATPase